MSGAPRRLPGLAAFSKPAAVWPVGFCAWCFGVFSVGVPLPCSRPVGCPPFFVWPALPACRLAVVGFVSGLQAACRFCANFCARCLVCPPCALCAHFRLVSAVCSPVLCCVRGFSLLSFTFSCLTFASQISFHLSLRPRRASTFFRKESRQRFAKGLRPFEPHSCALRPIFSSSALLAGLTALRAAIRRLTGKRSKKPRSRAQLFQAFLCEGGRLRPEAAHPLFLAAGRLTRPFGPQTAG